MSEHLQIVTELINNILSSDNDSIQKSTKLFNEAKVHDLNKFVTVLLNIAKSELQSLFFFLIF